MGGTVRLRELPGVAILNQIEVEVDELLVVLFGNPLVDAVKSEETIKVRKYFVTKQPWMNPRAAGLLTAVRRQA